MARNRFNGWANDIENLLQRKLIARQNQIQVVDDVRVSLKVYRDLTRVLTVADVLNKCKQRVNESRV